MTNLIFTPTSNPTEDKILFLDIDGVLHPDDAAFFNYENTAPMGVGLFRWAPILIKQLNKFPSIRVVISSTWRCIFPFHPLMSFLPEEIRQHVIDITPPEIYGRWEAIQAYISKHNVKNYVILDDMDKSFPYGLSELVKCYPKSGISNEQTLNNLVKQLERIDHG